MDLDSIFALSVMVIAVGGYTAGMWYLNSKVTVNEKGFYESTDEGSSDTRGLRAIVSVGGLVVLAFFLILMLALLIIVIFYSEFLG